MFKNLLSPPNLPDWPYSEELGTPWPIRLVSAIALLNGIFALLEVVSVRLSNRVEHLFPVDYDYGRLLGLFAGFVLIYFSTQLIRRKRVAWLVATIASLAVVLVHLAYNRDLAVLVLPATSLVLLITYRDLFYARSEPASIRQGFRRLVLSFVVALAYGTAGFLLVLHRDFAQPFNFWQAIGRTFQQFTLVGNTDLVPHTRYARWFLDSLDILGITSLGFAVISLFRPLTYRYRTQPQDRAQAQVILEKYGNSSEDFMKLWPEDKSYYFSAARDGFVAYKVVNGVAFALGDIVGPVKDYEAISRGFMAYCRRYGWSPCWLYATDRSREVLEGAGLRGFKIGEDAIVHLSSFMTNVAGTKHFKQAQNKFTRLGYTAEWLEPPQSSTIIREIGRVSRTWLQIPGRVERAFALGYFDARKLSDQTLFVVRNDQGVIEAFVNLVPSYDKDEAKSDLMRHVPGSPRGLMDYLFLELIRELDQRGCKRLNLGLAPFSGLEDQTERSLEEWFVNLLYRNEFKIFSFQGLRKYKENFEPAWEPRYVIYEGGPTGLARIGLAVNRLLEPPWRH